MNDNQATKDEQSESRKIEEVKLLFEYMKHISMLSTGSIMLLIAFLEKLFANPEWRILIGISLSGFAITILFSVIMQFMLLESFDPEAEQFGCLIPIFSLTVTGVSFMLGIGSLVLFALKNFL